MLSSWQRHSTLTSYENADIVGRNNMISFGHGSIYWQGHERPALLLSGIIYVPGKQ